MARPHRRSPFALVPFALIGDHLVPIPVALRVGNILFRRSPPVRIWSHPEIIEPVSSIRRFFFRCFSLQNIPLSSGCSAALCSNCSIVNPATIPMVSRNCPNVRFAELPTPLFSRWSFIKATIDDLSTPRRIPVASQAFTRSWICDFITGAESPEGSFFFRGAPFLIFSAKRGSCRGRWESPPTGVGG